MSGFQGAVGADRAGGGAGVGSPDEEKPCSGVEARGFIFGAALAVEFGVGFVPVRKAGKLPAATFSRSYELEYGSATLELHRDALGPEDRVVIVDDLLATGGTARAASELVEETGVRVVTAAFVIELPELGGRERLAPRNVVSLIAS